MSAETYFASVIGPIFDLPVAEIGGLRLSGVDPLTVRYEGAGWFVECYALLEDGPKYSPRVDIGPLPELAFDPRDKQIDIRNAVPNGNPLKDYNLLWRYRDREEMEKAFLKVRDEIFTPFAVPILRHKEALIDLVQTTSRELHRKWHEEIIQHNTSIIRRRADDAWRSRDYPKFVAEMRELPGNRLTELDAEKMRYALKRLNLP